MANVLVIDAHPDPDPARYCHALALGYADGAREGGHRVETIRLCDLDWPLLRSAEEWEHGEPAETVRSAQAAVARADHILMVFPLWLGDMPALLKAFLEQTMRPGFAFEHVKDGFPRKLLARKSARIVVTMGMPAFIYRWYFGAHAIKSLKRNILIFVGIDPVAITLIGGVGSMGDAARKNWLAEMAKLGRAGR